MNTFEGRTWPDFVDDPAAIYEGMQRSYDVATANADVLAHEIRLHPQFPSRRSIAHNGGIVTMYAETIFAEGTDYYAEAFGGSWVTFGGRALAHARAIKGPYGTEVVEAVTKLGVEPKPADWIHMRDSQFSGSPGYVMCRHNVAYPLTPL